MSNHYHGAQEPSRSWSEMSSSYFSDAELNSIDQSADGMWSFDELLGYSDATNLPPTSYPYYQAYEAFATGHISAALPTRRIPTPQSQTLFRTRRSQRSLPPSSPYVPTSPTSYPYSVPRRINTGEARSQLLDQPFISDLSDFPGATNEAEPASRRLSTRTPNQPIPQPRPGNRTSTAKRPGCRVRSLGQNKLQCTMKTCDGHRCTVLCAWPDTHKRHEDRHVQSLVWPCHTCEGVEFLTRAELKRHYRTDRHKGMVNPDPRPIKKMEIPEHLLYCPVNGCLSRRFESLDERRDHVRSWHPQYLYVHVPSQPSVAPSLDDINIGVSSNDGFESSPSTGYGVSPFSEQPRKSQYGRNRTDSFNSSFSSTTAYSTNEPSPQFAAAIRYSPTYSTLGFQSLPEQTEHSTWSWVPEAHESYGIGTSLPDSFDFSGHRAPQISYNGELHPTISVHPLPTLLSSAHSGSSNPDHGFIALNPPRASSDSTRTTMYTAIAELTDVFDHANIGWNSGTRPSSPEIDDDVDSLPIAKNSRAAHQLRQIYSDNMAEQRPTRQSFIRRMLSGKNSAGPSPQDLAERTVRRKGRNEGDAWEIISKHGGDERLDPF